MNRKLKTVLCAALVLLLMFSCCCLSFADEPMPVTVKAKAAVLMDVDSGKVLMSMNADEKHAPPARDRSARQREDIAQRHRNRLRLCRIKRRLADMAQRGRADDGR